MKSPSFNFGGAIPRSASCRRHGILVLCRLGKGGQTNQKNEKGETFEKLHGGKRAGSGKGVDGECPENEANQGQSIPVSWDDLKCFRGLEGWVVALQGVRGRVWRGGARHGTTRIPPRSRPPGFPGCGAVERATAPLVVRRGASRPIGLCFKCLLDRMWGGIHVFASFSFCRLP